MGTYSMERLIKKYINILPIAYPHQGKEFFTTMYAVSDVFQMHQIQRTVSSFAAE